MSPDSYEARLVAAEIAIDALLAEIDELRERLEAHARTCPNVTNEIDLS
jgi:hypothetical protein